MLGGYLNNKQLLQKVNEENEQLKKKIRNYEIKLDEYKTENDELKEIRKEAEHRATTYARAIKKIEDIIFQKGQGSIIDRIDKIKEVLSDLTNQL